MFELLKNKNVKSTWYTLLGIGDGENGAMQRTSGWVGTMWLQD